MFSPTYFNWFSFMTCGPTIWLGKCRKDNWYKQQNTISQRASQDNENILWPFELWGISALVEVSIGEAALSAGNSHLRVFSLDGFPHESSLSSLSMQYTARKQFARLLSKPTSVAEVMVMFESQTMCQAFCHCLMSWQHL